MKWSTNLEVHYIKYVYFTHISGRAFMVTVLAWSILWKMKQNVTFVVQWYSTYWQEKRSDNPSSATFIHLIIGLLAISLQLMFAVSGCRRRYHIVQAWGSTWQFKVLQATHVRHMGNARTCKACRQDRDLLWDLANSFENIMPHHLFVTGYISGCYL